MLKVPSASVTKPTPKPTILDLPLNRKDFPPDFFFGTVGLPMKFKQANQNDKIGIVLVHFWMVPYSDSPADVSAAERPTDFLFGWFLEPINTGEYPQSMQDLVGPRLPRFYKEQSELLKGSYDFLGILPTDGEFPPKNPSYNNDARVIQTSVSDDSNLPIEKARKDEERKASLRDHLKYLVAAMKEGVDVKGFFVWILLDNFEWNVGFTLRFGMNYVDFNNGLKRYPKESAPWFKNFLKAD
ncbi:hypothetical protein NE237_030920 [Protea cynaroides]|uniref:Beta-glucosidase n=1 Tax=Protea cynaroides TaxID=273540 RepID=A0A9Q0GUL8_9MAGN|nr:hypothetical protein NE237_030920 [Protea cynaroides]